MNKHSDEQSESEHGEKPAGIQGLSRRHLLNTPLALAAGSIAIPSLLGGLAGEAKAEHNSDDPKFAPRYFPLSRFRPDINLRGKLAVITGASRGLGRAVGEALTVRGVDVIGTSRNPAGVPNPLPAFPLLQLDVADPASVSAFPTALRAHRLFQRHKHVDILANNAGRQVPGQIIPLPPTDLSFYLAQRALAVRTLYFGHMMMTNVMLPLMPQQGYSRIIFTISVASYLTGAGVSGGSFFDTYNSSKAALRAYANSLGAAFHDGGSSIRVSTVNPYFMNTALCAPPNPIYTQPVNASGLSDTDPIFNAIITYVRQLLANGLPPSMVGETYAQLLEMAGPEKNVVVASPREPLATQGANAIIESELLAENQMSAVPFK